VLAALVTALVITLLPIALDRLRDTPEWLDTSAIALGFLLPIAVGLWAALRTRKRLRTSFPVTAVADALGAKSVALRLRSVGVRKATWSAVAALYFVTWSFGVPAVQTRYTQDEINPYKRLEAKTHGPEWKPFPTIRTVFAIPILLEPSCAFTSTSLPDCGVGAGGRFTSGT